MKVLERLTADASAHQVIVPQLIQATLAAISDVAVYSLAERVLGKRYALAAVRGSLLPQQHARGLLHMLRRLERKGKLQRRNID